MIQYISRNSFIRCILFSLFFLFSWLLFGFGNSAHAATLPTPTIQAQTSWTNQDVHVSLSGSGNLQYEIDGGGGQGTTADGGQSSNGSSTPDSGTYYYAKDRYIDLSKDISINNIKSIQVTTNTGATNPTVYTTNIYGSNDGDHWIYLGDARSNALEVGNQYVSYPLNLTNNDLTNAGFAKSDRIRYIKAHNDFCLDSFWMTIVADQTYSYNAGGGSNPNGFGITGNYGGTWSNYTGDIVVSSEGVHSVKARAVLSLIHI